MKIRSNILQVSRYLICLAIVLGFPGLSVNAHAAYVDLRNAIETKVKGDITSAIVLTDANLITLGIVDFNPNSFVDLSEIGDINVGDEDTLRRRSQLKSYTIPWESDETKLSPQWTSSFGARFSYVNATDSIEGIDDKSLHSPLEDTSYLLAGEYRWKYKINNNWDLALGLGGQFIWLENTLKYRDPLLEELSELFDNALVNTRYGALMFDPNAELTYASQWYGHKWEFISSLRYAVGRTLFTDDGTQAVSPQVGRFSNAFVFHYQLPNAWDNRNEMRLLAKRVDLTGDVVDPMGTHYYYELGAGWIIETPSLSSWLDNIGVGITLNINSGLSGGGIVLLLNEEL
ncbi:Solitary outer membrane autotransporter beta-barrel domain [Shewanella mesophila]|uniref:Solitary outer membrane autotransporter beta-barrel domain n=1 Tax=Shewanella mesophila TaxID=2864208 RepID=UPI0021ABFAB2|nr:Solitary outer membrane autotransporter beta-barrel domain [Shewanella mesophila]